jgi:enoyl-CoA hydratase
MRKYESLEVEADGVIATIMLVRPDELNRFDATLHREFTEVLTELRSRNNLRAILIGSTGKVFSAGGDADLIRSYHDDPDERQGGIDEGKRLIGTLIDLPIPVVVGVQGPAIGLAATIVLGCDAVVACRSARLADPHVLVGLVAGDGGCLVWPQAAGMLRAKRHLLTGDPLSAEDAFTMGLVTDLVDTPEEVLPAARHVAERIASLPPLAVQGTKRALNRVMQQRAGEVLDLSFAYEAQTLASDDLLEALDAFKNRRAGVFRGR